MWSFVSAMIPDDQRLFTHWAHVLKKILLTMFGHRRWTSTCTLPFIINLFLKEWLRHSSLLPNICTSQRVSPFHQWSSRQNSTERICAVMSQPPQSTPPPPWRFRWIRKGRKCTLWEHSRANDPKERDTYAVEFVRLPWRMGKRERTTC